MAVSLMACSDDDSTIEFLFDREASDVSVLRSCAKEGDTAACYRIRLRYPMETENLERIYMWVDTTVVDDTSKAVSSDQLSKATAKFDYPKGTKALYDTIDVTSYAEKYRDTYDSLQVAFYCEYSDNGDPGAVQRVFLHFGDDMPPSRASIYDSVWTTGALIEWYRPTDQTDFYKPMELSGPIVGYNLVLYSSDKNEDLRNVKVHLYSPDGEDSTGARLYKRHFRIRANNDSVWVDGVGHGDNVKNYLRFVVLDGKGFDFDTDSLNRFRVVFEGLKADPGITEQIRNGRAQAKTFGGFVEYLKTLHGDDWEQVFDADTDSVLRHAEQIGDFFHKPIDELKVPMLLTGSLEDDMFPKGHCKALFDEICAKTSFATAHIFERGGHPAMLSNMDEFVELLSVNG